MFWINWRTTKDLNFLAFFHLIAPWGPIVAMRDKNFFLTTNTDLNNYYQQRGIERWKRTNVITCEGGDIKWPPKI